MSIFAKMKRERPDRRQGRGGSPNPALLAVATIRGPVAAGLPYGLAPGAACGGTRVLLAGGALPGERVAGRRPVRRAATADHSAGARPRLSR